MQDTISDLSSTLPFKLSLLSFLPSNFEEISLSFHFKRAYLDKSDPKVEDLRSALIKAALIKIVVDFIQVLNLTSEFDFIWPSEVIRILFTFFNKFSF